MKKCSLLVFLLVATYGFGQVGMAGGVSQMPPRSTPRPEGPGGFRRPGGAHTPLGAVARPGGSEALGPPGRERGDTLVQSPEGAQAGSRRREPPE